MERTFTIPDPTFLSLKHAPCTKALSFEIVSFDLVVAQVKVNSLQDPRLQELKVSTAFHSLIRLHCAVPRGK